MMLEGDYVLSLLLHYLRHMTFYMVRLVLRHHVAELRNQHIFETARGLLVGSHVPRGYLSNRMPSKVLNFNSVEDS